MRAGVFVVYLLVGICPSFLRAAAAQSPPIQRNLNLPLAFERDGERTYVARGQGYTISIRDAKAFLTMVPGPGRGASAISIEFAGGRHAEGAPGAELPGKVNYIRGNDSSQWKLGLPTYGQVTYGNIYRGVDLVYYGKQRQLEFDLVVRPGANPRSIRMKLSGARQISIDATGKLLLRTEAGEIRMDLPRIYQGEGSARKTVAGRYVVRGRNEIGFEAAAYDRRKPLVIDPTIVYSILFPANPSAIAIDGSGNMYVAGLAGSGFETLPIANEAQSTSAGPENVLVSKINAAGTAFIYSTYLGGSVLDTFSGIAVDSTGAAWVTGYTESPDFPTMNPFQSVFGGNTDAVVVKLSAAGALLYSTYLGGPGPDYGFGVAIDSLNNAYVTGTAGNMFPTTPGVVDSTSQEDDAFVTKFTSSGALVYSTLLGGAGSDGGNGIAVDSSGNAYVTGSTSSPGFTGAPGGGAQPTYGGNFDAFVAKLNPTGTAIVYFTFFGGSGGEFGTGIAIDPNQNVYIVGSTSSTDLSLTPGALQKDYAGDSDAFVAKLNSTGTAFSLVTYLGGRRSDWITGVAYDAAS